jgi:hypothetical protein
MGTDLALNFAIGALVAHDTAKGKSAFAGIDVERLFASIQMLSERESLEVAPFVSVWSVGLDTIRRQDRLPSFYGKNFMESLFSESASPSRFEQLFVKGVEAITSKRLADEIYTDLKGQMIAALQRCLKLDGSTVDYLSPLLSSTGEPIQIATLNYDRSIEFLCGRSGRELATGVSLWAGGYDWDWEAGADVRLLKLHGSIDWTLGTITPNNGLPEEKIAVDGLPDQPDIRRGSLGVVFGQREKLRSEGPFLAMLREFDKFLDVADHLVVVGYSFRDAHINSAIRRWFNAHKSPRVTIIDPALKDHRDIFGYYAADRSGASRFFVDLLEAMRDESKTRMSRELKSPHQILPVGASAGLLQVFGQGPQLSSVEDLLSLATDEELDESS